MTSGQIPTDVGAAFASEKMKPDESNWDNLGSRRKDQAAAGVCKLWRHFPWPLTPSTGCLWGELSWFSPQKREKCCAHGCLVVLPSLCYLFLFVGAAPTASCDSQTIAMTLDPLTHVLANTDDVCGAPTDNVCKTKEFCSRIFLETSAVQFFVSYIFVYCYFEENNIALFFPHFFLISCLLI